MKTLELIIKFNVQLLEKSFESYFKKQSYLEVDKIIPIVLYNSIIEKSKSLSVLVNNESFAGVDVLVRSIFEQYVLLMFILEKDYVKRSEAFHYSTVLRSIEYGEELSKDDNFSLLGEMFGGEHRFQAIKAYSSSEYQDIIDKFKELTGANKSSHWFKVAEENDIKINNFKELCKYMGKEIFAEYISLYAQLSQEAHGKDASKYYKATENSFSLIQKEEADLPILLITRKLFEIPKKISEYYKIDKDYKTLLNKYSYQLQEFIKHKKRFKKTVY